jgi:hypothetical protein
LSPSASTSSSSSSSTSSSSSLASPKRPGAWQTLRSTVASRGVFRGLYAGFPVYVVQRHVTRCHFVFCNHCVCCT